MNISDRLREGDLAKARRNVQVAERTLARMGESVSRAWYANDAARYQAAKLTMQTYYTQFVLPMRAQVLRLQGKLESV